MLATYLKSLNENDRVLNNEGEDVIQGLIQSPKTLPLNIFMMITVQNYLNKYVNYQNITQHEQKHGFYANMPMK